MTITPPSTHFATGLKELADLAMKVGEALGPELVEAQAMVREIGDRHDGPLADAQHLATEYVVRYMRSRRPYPAVALTTDSSLLTAAGNDLGFEQVFARQVDALAKPGDLLIIHSTSGNSPNVLRAAEAARAKAVKVLAFSARDGGELRALADLSVIIPTDRTDRAQELHLCIEHLICELVEHEL